MKFSFVLVLSLCFGYAQERIVTLSPSLSEIVFALGKGSEVVGVSKYSTYPKAVQALPKIGGYFSPSIESILILRPTLVVGQMHDEKLLHDLQKAGVQTLQVKLQHLDDIQRSIQVIAKRLNTDASKVIRPIKEAIQKAKTYPRTDKKVLVMYGAPKNIKRNVMYVAGTNTFYNDILTLCGAKNASVTAFNSEPRLFFETLLARNPDVVLILHSQLTDGVAHKKQILSQWKNLPITASKNHAVRVLDNSALLIPSQRVAQTIQRICTEIHK